jgi:hypothetical protein
MPQTVRVTRSSAPLPDMPIQIQDRPHRDGRAPKKRVAYDILLQREAVPWCELLRFMRLADVARQLSESPWVAP